MRNSELFLFRIFVTKHLYSVGADFISVRYTPYFRQNFCRGRVVRPESRSDFRHTKFIFRKQKEPVFKESKSLKTGSFINYETPCGAGRGTVPYRKFGVYREYAEQKQFRILSYRYISKAMFPRSNLKKFLSTGISLKPAFL